MSDPVKENDEQSDKLSDVAVLDIPAFVIFTVLFVIVALQFFTRYVLNDSLGWTEEIARYFLIMLGFVGAIICVRKESHIRLEFLYYYLPISWIRPTVLAIALISVGFWFYAGWLGIELAMKTRANMASISVPKAYIYYVVAAACFVMAAYALKNFMVKRRKSLEEVARETLDPTPGGL